MATTHFPFNGSFGGGSFYNRNGQTLVRTKGGASKKTILQSPSCAAIVKSNIEFGGASHVGALLRRSIGPKLKYFSDTNMIGNLTGVLRSMIQLGSGEPGQRILDLGACAAMLEGFEFNENKPLYSCLATDVIFTISEQLDAAVLQARFCPAEDLHTPAGATAFQIQHMVLCVPRYGLCAVTKKYKALYDAVLTGAQTSSAILYPDLSMQVSLKLPVQLPSTAVAHSTLLCIVGIAFFQGNELMKGACGMKVVRIVCQHTNECFQ